MKKFGLILGMLIILVGATSAQSSGDYKSRNRKMHKGYKLKSEAVKPIAVPNGEIEDNFYNYKKRNTKFHKIKRDYSLLIKKDKIVYDYKVFNRKLNKGQLSKFVKLSDKNE